MVSVIMPAYNSGAYIQDAVTSVLNQTYENFELLIVDDASTDNTEEIIRMFNDSRIRYFKNNSRMGAAICRNFALRNAKGKYVAFLDSDDLWLPEKLENQIAFMEQKGYAFSYTAYEEMDETGNRSGKRVSGPETVSERGMYAYCWPGCLTVMYDKAQLGDLEIYPIERNNDYAMWLKLIKKADLHLLDECLAVYRKRTDSVSGQKLSVLIRYHYLLYRLCDNRGKFQSILLTGLNMICGVYKKLWYAKRTAGSKR
ncbi:MAG: glycosyltransferase family 2 protein [Clostridia bacterium]|nr:glycosyltransferase family 2 protein [Clostridia bacterium]